MRTNSTPEPPAAGVLHVKARRDQITGKWLLTCDLCPMRDSYHKFWIARRSQLAHEAMHAAERA